MSNVRRILTSILFPTIAIILASACSAPNIAASSSPQYDTRPEAVIIYAYIHYPGVPEPTKTPNDRYCEYLPSLIVWGDGLVFLDENIKNEYNSVLSGTLDGATLLKLLDTLDADHFFSGWQAPGPNPSGTSLKIGAQLKDKPVTEYDSGSLGPSVYLELIRTIKPALNPLSEQSIVDQRIEDMLKENANCNKYIITEIQFPFEKVSVPAQR